MTDFKHDEKLGDVAPPSPYTEEVDADTLASSPSEEPHSRWKASAIDPDSQAPDGGLNAWLKVLGCFLMYANVW